MTGGQRIWLVRHGPTHLKAAIGWTDVRADLSDHAQISRLRDALPEDGVMISSDLKRARDTGDAISSGQRRLADDPDFRELNFGDWEGLSFDEIGKTDPDLARRYWDEPGDLAPPNGESWNVFSSRVTRAYDRLLAQTDAADVIIVVHFGVIVALIQHAAGMAAKPALAFEISNLSLTRIDRFEAGSGSRIVLVNKTF